MIPFVACVPSPSVPSKIAALCVRLSIILAVFAGLLLPASLVAQVTFEPNWVQQSPATVSSGPITFGSQAIGSASSAQALTFSISSGTTVGSIGVVTQGAPGLDFTDAGGSTCTAKTYSSDTNCTINAKFKPTVAGLRMGAVVFYSGANLSGTQRARVPIFGIGTGPQIAYGPGVQTTVASKGLNGPFGVAVDGAGDVFITDNGNNRVVKVPAAGGAQTTVGTGLNQPYGVAVDGAGDVFIADVGNNHVVEIPAGGGAQTTVGTGLNQPYGVAVDGAGDVFITDMGHNRVLEVPAGGGAQTTVGTGLHEPFGVAVDGAGDVFIADTFNNRVVEVPAGGGAQTTVDSGLNYPAGVAVDGAGDVFIADSNNSRVVEIPAGGGAQTTLGSGLFVPVGVTVDGAGDVFIADHGNNRLVEERRSQPPTLTFPAATVVGTTDSTDGTLTVAIMNIGNSDLNFAAALSYPADFSEASGDSNACTSLTSLSAGQECDVPVEFTPQNSGPLREKVTLTDNNLNGSSAQQNIPVAGNVPPALVITWTTPQAIAYPTPLSGTQLDATANVAGTFTYNYAVGTVLKAGLQTLKATFTPTDTTDYSVTMAQVTLQVNKATPKIEWSPAPLQIDSKLGAEQLDATANVPGKFVYTPDAGTEIKTTTETLKAVFTPKDTTDYESVTTTVALPVSVIKVSPTSINFGTVNLNSITTKDVTVSNLGPDPVTIYNPLISIVKNGDSREFVEENLCPKALEAQKSCTIKVEFDAGPFYHQQSATLNVSDSSPGSPQTVSLTALTKEP
jgi:sugar lactone lactonase YvrE